jgi:hypothetical protein
MNSTLLNTLRFIGLILLQVLILNHIELIGYVNPFVYILFVLMLPLSTPGWLLLLLSFGTGYTIDVFMSSAGLHTAATVFMAFMRPYVVQLATGAKDPEMLNNPGLSQMGIRWWFSYSLSLVFLHHFALFLLESFSFSQLGYTLIRIVLSVLFTEILILLLSYFFATRPKKKK